MKETLKYWVWLGSLSGIGPRKRFQLIELFGDAKNVWDASSEQLKQSGFLTAKNIEHLVDKELRTKVDECVEAIDKLGISVITMDDELYPEGLRNIYDPPIVLYAKGSLLKGEKAVAIVGARNATSYGLSAAESIGYELSRYGITVVSGMARGIDSWAHGGALKSGGRTIAVLGCGLDIVYPSENEKLMQKIIASGAVISEYVPGMPPLTYNFPARNRVISGICLGVVIVEANDQSGSLITANFALEHGREVFAVPGNINSKYSTGTNKLIRDGAKIVTGIEDILEELKIFKNTNNNSVGCKNLQEEAIFNGLDGDERLVALCLKEEHMHIDALVAKTGLSIQAVNSLLVMLELKGVVEQTPGKIFKLK